MDEVIGRAEGLPLGRRVAYWRSRRGLSQQVFADRLGKSKSWVDKVERGVRRLDRYSVLHEIADALHVDVQLLLGRAPARRDSRTPSGVDETAVEAVRAALTRHVGIGGRRPETVPGTAELGRAVGHAWLCLGRGDYDRLLRTLPRLIGQAQWARAEHRDDQSAALLGQAYQITADLLRRIGEHHLGWLAADRAVTTCADSGDPLLAGRAVVTLAEVVRAAGRPRYAVELAVTMVHRLSRPSPHLDETGRLCVTGVLLLQASMAAAATADTGAATRLLDHATQTANQLGPGHDRYHTDFGIALVGVVRLAAAVELGHGRTALAALADLTTRPDYQKLPAAVRAAHLIQTARAHLQAGDPTAAGHALLDAARTAPAEVRTRPVARQTLATIVRRLNRPGPVTRLAETIGVTP